MTDTTVVTFKFDSEEQVDAFCQGLKIAGRETWISAVRREVEPGTGLAGRYLVDINNYADVRELALPFSADVRKYPLTPAQSQAELDARHSGAMGDPYGQIAVDGVVATAEAAGEDSVNFKGAVVS